MAQDRHTAGSFWASFGYAAHGLWWAYRHERNLRVHTVLGAVAVALGMLEGIGPTKFLVLVVLLILVVALELVNTAIEAVTDLAHPGFSPLAGVAKDLAAAAVLFGAAGALVLGVWILGGRLPEIPGRVGVWAAHTPAGLALLGAGLAFVAAAAVWPSPARREEADGH